MTLDDLDRLAAEKVMGWHIDDPAMLMKRWITNRRDYFTLSTESWKPTRDIAQAWDMLLKRIDCGAGPFSVTLNTSYGIEAKCGWNVVIDGICYESWSKTAPEAIVRACLKFKGVI